MSGGHPEQGRPGQEDYEVNTKPFGFFGGGGRIQIPRTLLRVSYLETFHQGGNLWQYWVAVLKPRISTLHVTPDQTLSLSELRGRPVMLAFYPADWSPVCGDQMALYNEILPEFQKHEAELLGISVDGAWCHAAFARERSCISRCSPTSSRKARSRENTAPTGKKKGCASALCS